MNRSYKFRLWTSNDSLTFWEYRVEKLKEGLWGWKTLRWIKSSFVFRVRASKKVAGVENRNLFFFPQIFPFSFDFFSQLGSNASNEMKWNEMNTRKKYLQWFVVSRNSVEEKRFFSLLVGMFLFLLLMLVGWFSIFVRNLSLEVRRRRSVKDFIRLWMLRLDWLIYERLRRLCK